MLVFSIFISLAIISFLIYIAIPNFLSFNWRANQSEAKRNLTDLYNKQREYFSKNGKYADTFDKLGWSPSGNAVKSMFRYAYFLSAKEVIQPDGQSFYDWGGAKHGNSDKCDEGKWVTPKANYSLPQGIKAFVSDNHFQIIAVSNIDPDPALDVWSIEEKGELKNLIDDYVAK